MEAEPALFCLKDLSSDRLCLPNSSAQVEVDNCKTWIPPPFGSRIAIVTISYGAELYLLKMQARSLSRFLVEKQYFSIYVIVNDFSPGSFRDRFNEFVLPEYGELIERVRLIPRTDVVSCHWSRNGWRTQQALKLLAGNFIIEDHVVILDTKNHFFRPVERDRLVGQDGKAITYLEECPSQLVPELKSVYKYFGLNLRQHTESCLTNFTPFSVPRQLLVEAVKEIETRENMSLMKFFFGRGHAMTEFLLISAYCLARYGSLEAVFKFAEPGVVGVWKATLLKPSGVECEIERAATSLEKFSFSVHIDAVTTLKKSQIEAVGAFWRSCGLLYSDEHPSLFLRRAS